MMTEKDVERINALRNSMEDAGNNFKNSIGNISKMLVSKLSLAIFVVFGMTLWFFVGMSGDNKGE